MENPLIVALDVGNRDVAMRLVEQLAPVAGMFKIGSELFTAEGPSIVKDILNAGGRVFLDLKYHDIPATVGKAVASATSLGVSMLTIHTSGGGAMMKAAVESARTNAEKRNFPAPLILGVTVLTSMGDIELAEIGLNCGTAEQVLRLARLAVNSGIGGLVCSPLELKMLREALPSKITLVTPGIRSANELKNDQKRTMTAGEAIKAGANYIVVGRPICADPNPRLAAERILQEISSCC